jgi:hypothetical protein
VEVLPCIYAFAATTVSWLGMAAIQPRQAGGPEA